MLTRLFRSRILAAWAAALALAGCGEVDVATQRAERAARATGDIVIGVSWPFNAAKSTYWDGVEMARDELNGRGGVLGRRLALVKQDDRLSVTRGAVIAHEFASNLDMVAVIGTLNSYIAVASAPVLEAAGLVYLNHGSVVNLTSQGYRNVLRMIPSNRNVGELLADHARQRGFKRVLVYYVKNEYGLDLANAFEQRAATVGVEVADRVSYLSGASDYRLAMQHWRDFYQFDAIFLAGSLPEGAAIIQDIRAVGIRSPIFSAAGLDSPELARLGGALTEGVEVVSFFHPADPSDRVVEFNQRFHARYGRLPDTSAALGHDAVMLMADAITRANSTVPSRISQALRAPQGWQGVTGLHRFDELGNLQDKAIVLQVVRKGQFEFVRTMGGRPASPAQGKPEPA